MPEPLAAIRLNACRFIQNILLLSLLLIALTGCQSARYFTQAARGQLELLQLRQPVAVLLNDTNLSPNLRHSFLLTEQICQFAASQLHLPADSHYQHYVDLDRPYVVWNVHASPEFSLKAKTWRYPIVGRLTYRGFFDAKAAQDCAARLKRKQFDVYIEGVETYSTLGWFRDPLLSTFIHHPKTVLAEILFHELAHQKLFAAGKTDFNEAFATATAEEGVRRFLRATGDLDALQRFETATLRQRQFIALIADTRQLLQELFLLPLPAPEMRLRKAQILHLLQDDYQRLKLQWNGFAGYDSWFAQPLNNAQLNSVATYYDLVPAFERLLANSNGDLRQFYRKARALSKQHKQSDPE